MHSLRCFAIASSTNRQKSALTPRPSHQSRRRLKCRLQPPKVPPRFTQPQRRIQHQVPQLKHNSAHRNLHQEQNELRIPFRWRTPGNGNFVDSRFDSLNVVRDVGWLYAASSPARSTVRTASMGTFSSLWVRAYQLSSHHLRRSMPKTMLDSSWMADS